MKNYSVFDKTIHLRPDFKKRKFENIHDWVFGWEILEPINVATDQEDSEIELSRRLSPGQKALYFFWYLDAQVTNGGFIQFYWNGYRKYLDAILQGLQLIGDDDMLRLVKIADEEYLLNEKRFEEFQKINDSERLYEDLPKFDEYDAKYYQLHSQTMFLIEKYARANIDQFVRLVD